MTTYPAFDQDEEVQQFTDTNEWEFQGGETPQELRDVCEDYLAERKAGEATSRTAWDSTSNWMNADEQDNQSSENSNQGRNHYPNEQ